MLNLSSIGTMSIYVYLPPTDMRQGFDGLSGIVRSELQSDPTDGSLFVFINRRRDRMKLLHFDGGGFWLYYRLLEAGTFEALTAADGSRQLQIDATQLAMWLAGVSLAAWSRRRKRYAAKSTAEQAA
jgi:transposase